MFNFFLLTFAGIGIRDIIYNCSVRFARSKVWESQLASASPQKAYNEVFLSFSIQHALVHVFFTVTGILYLFFPVSTQLTRALFFHDFLWEVSIFVRDAKYFSPKFITFYWAHHALTILLGIGWLFWGTFDQLQGALGFLVLVFLGSALTSSVSFFFRIFVERNSFFYRTELALTILQRFWRWGVIVASLCLFWTTPRLDNTSAFVTVLLSGLCMEALDILFIWKKYFRTSSPLKSAQNDNKKEVMEDSSTDEESLNGEESV